MNYTEIFPRAKEVYDKLMDEESKKVFSLRMLYNMTSDFNYLMELISEIPEFKSGQLKTLMEIYNEYKRVTDSNPECQFIIYGTGRWGSILHKALTQNLNTLFGHMKISGFCDKSLEKQNSGFLGLPVISPEKLIQEHQSHYVINATLHNQEEIKSELMKMGFPEKQILRGDLLFEFELLLKKQYFEEPIIQPQENEVFVDGGCFNCDTSLVFREWCSGNYEKIYAFEPDAANYLKCKSVMNDSNLERVELYNAGLWSRTSVMNFNAEANVASHFTQEGTDLVQVLRLDEVLEGRKASLIKLDIEGSELEALKGARETITKYRPRLAICLYHKPEDILEIPLYILSLVPDYNLYIRHYSNLPNETVLYAI